jgi:phosphomannomutase
VGDYKSSVWKCTGDGSTTPTDCIVGDVVVLELDGDRRRRISVRPSGTEPKLKFYMQWFEEAGEDVEVQLETVQHHVEGMARELEGLLLEN